MDAVVSDLEAGDARALALPRFQIYEKCAGVFREAAKLIQLGIEALCYHAAVADDRGRGLYECGRKKCSNVRVRRDTGMQGAEPWIIQRFELGTQRRDRMQCAAQPREIPRRCRAQGYA